ncbi:TIGR04104 family putative zinc finger protein [Aliicoccus persicus]|uniref:Cxxc_20_cxxc protein n=1 Tax=Aliicoccus persicus TaxID=930138 RepID=A0A662Z4L0_9STAP|nr:TIGR04104 family putative zinc finger protein [Aliicoccus persicus]SEW11354.1 cxxc_20_cxxc protein [Aliicoccus persicus]
MAVCPYCNHKWSYKERLLGYSLKLRSRIRCKNCKEYLEPSNLSIFYDILAVLGVAAMILFVIPVLRWPMGISIGLSIFILLLYVFFFVPNTVRFKTYTYRRNKDFYKKGNKW